MCYSGLPGWFLLPSLDRLAGSAPIPETLGDAHGLLIGLTAMPN